MTGRRPGQLPGQLQSNGFVIFVIFCSPAECHEPELVLPAGSTKEQFRRLTKPFDEGLLFSIIAAYGLDGITAQWTKAQQFAPTPAQPVKTVFAEELAAMLAAVGRHNRTVPAAGN